MIFTDGISIRKLASICKCSEGLIRTLIKTGWVEKDENLKVSASEGKAGFERYKEQLNKKTENQSKTTAAKLIDNLKKTNDSADFEKLYNQWLSNIEDNPIGTLNEVKAYLVALQVREQKMKVDEMEKRLIPVERVNHDAEEIGTLIRGKLISIPSRVATICEGRTARDIEEIIDVEINKTLEELQKLFV